MKAKILFFNILVFTFFFLFNIHKVQELLEKYIYPLDDTYIHLSIAKNFALHNVWGITEYEFSSTTSSPLYTMLLSCLIRLFGNNEFYPLLLNYFASIGLYFTLHKFVIKQSLIKYSLVILLTTLLFPLHSIALIGMEHVFHAWFLALFLCFYTAYRKQQSFRNFILLFLSSILAVGFRYESLFFVFFVCADLFFVKKRFVPSILLGLLSLLPVVIYGLISINFGSYFLPNSLVLKGNTSGDLIKSVIKVAGNISRSFSVSLIAVAVFFLFIKNKKGLKINWYNYLSKEYLTAIILGGFFLHMIFSNFGWLIRYEAYLIPLLLITFVIQWKENFLKNNGFYIQFGFIMLILIFSFYNRFVYMEKFEIQASKNIHDQQIQMAEFINKYYKDSKVIANDIGAITYFNDIELVDTYGLGSIDVARIRKKDFGVFDNTNPELTNYLHQQAEQGFTIAVVYDNWALLSPEFKKAGSWTISNNFICGNPTVSFYEVGNQNLRKNLAEYEKRKLPKDVSVRK